MPAHTLGSSSTTSSLSNRLPISLLTGFIVCRCLIGFSLATFVCSQTWCAQMFSRSIIGVANATAAGWGNLGGGITNLVTNSNLNSDVSYLNHNPY